MGHTNTEKKNVVHLRVEFTWCPVLYLVTVDGKPVGCTWGSSVADLCLWTTGQQDLAEGSTCCFSASQKQEGAL